jgi:hypothetical protein
VIAYPWGSYNRGKYNKERESYISYTSPDYTLFESFAIRLQEKAGAPIMFEKLPGYLIKHYLIGDMTTTVYPVHGGMEDWAYAAGWDINDGTGTMNDCKPDTYPLESSIDLSFAA